MDKLRGKKGLTEEALNEGVKNLARIIEADLMKEVLNDMPHKHSTRSKYASLQKGKNDRSEEK